MSTKPNLAPVDGPPTPAELERMRTVRGLVNLIVWGVVEQDGRRSARPDLPRVAQRAVALARLLGDRDLTSMTQREFAELLGIHESRVSILLAKAKAETGLG
jgi:hypothetical protein